MFFSTNILLFGYLALATLAWAGTVTYDWNVTWVWAKPDGFARSVIGINGKWPCPTMEATVGDTVVVNLTNKLGNQTTGLHFHGIEQVQTADMDGPSGTTQCPLPPNMTVKYQFTVDAPGTFWCRCHPRIFAHCSRLTSEKQTTRTTWASTLMDCEGRSLFMTPTIRTRAATTRSIP
jgi:iron transport multicopper oxidase